MLLALSQRSTSIAWFCVLLLYFELAMPLLLGAKQQDRFYLPHIDRESPTNSYISKLPALSPLVQSKKELSVKQLLGGPGQPEMQAFSSVNNSNMVDLFTGDFSYNIPLMDVGGYPVNLSYRGGITMDQEASWCGLGFNINPGTITRNLRGLPDDFNGEDSIKKINSIKENKTVGVTAGLDFELKGFPMKAGASLGVFHNNYRGWGLEHGLNATINSGTGAKGPLSGGLSITNNSQEGLTIAPSLSLRLTQEETETNAGMVSSFSVSAPYNSRYGLKGLQVSAGIQQTMKDKDNQLGSSSPFTSFISFASPSYTPSITMPFTSRQFSFKARIGTEKIVASSSAFVSGYVSKQKIEDADTLMALPAYGYLHYQQGAQNRSSLLDFNREKELTYREKPAVPHIAIPIYTYDAFSITGEGTGGMFRAYRGDIGFIHDHFIRTKDASSGLSLDFGAGNFIHAGVDLNINRAYTQNGPWLNDNSMKNVIAFQKDSANFEAAYFRNPGEKAINSKQFYETIGDDDVVTVNLFQASSASSSIQATNYLTRYRNKQPIGNILLKPQDVVKKTRDKRSQVISYLNAKEASIVGLSKYIENYTPNQFNFGNCNTEVSDDVEGSGTGLLAEYYTKMNFSGVRYVRIDTVINNIWERDPAYDTTGFPIDKISVRWTGRLKAPVTGTYSIKAVSDDGVRVWLNDSLLINQWSDHAPTPYSASVNLVAGELYTLKVEYYDNLRDASLQLLWTPPLQSEQIIHTAYLYPPPSTDTFQVNTYLSKEKRQNAFRKNNHLSEVTVLNNDGRRYVYGTPVYNFKQKEATFAINNTRGNKNTGLAGFTPGVDNTAKNNRNGKDWYYNSEEVPAYAHSFLLTGILSPDYIDITGNGISDDDRGDAVKFNYSKIRGIANPYKWRAPYVQDSVTLNEGLKTDTRDDKGSYVYGEKELWYLHSIISKTMVATFTLENRLDLSAIDEAGHKYNDSSAKRLKEINLYNRADFNKNGTNARPIKTVHFEYDYSLCKGVNKPVNDTGKLTLRKIWFTYNGNNKGKQNPYIFNYNSKNPGYNIRSYDRWGNYKDPMQNPGSVTNNVIRNDEYPYALQDSAAASQNAAAWTLDSIYLPSGGAIKVDYEGDDYAFVQNKRAMQLCKLAGLGNDTVLPSGALNKLYTNTNENLYVYITVPVAVSSKRDVYYKYLADIKKFFFRLSVKMPSDQHGSGYEYVSCYADLENANSYGMINSTTIWLKLSGISLKGDEDGSYSPLAKAGIQFLRLNLPSKAYPGSEIGDNIDLDKAIRMIASLGDNIKTAFTSFDGTARNNKWASEVDLNRSHVRLNNPVYKKYGGGYRVKRIKIYDNWNKMTGQKSAVYGQEYIYTTIEQVNGVATTISSGVASYEPGLGGEENPFRRPIEYVEKVAPLGPVALAYSEEPLGESLFPSPGVGYSKVRVRTINYQNKRSANGFEETQFYTARDFPVFTDRSMLDNNTKKRFKPALANFLRINARHYLSLSQGFKIELNDMHGKIRSQASYAETDAINPIKYTENIYRVENSQADYKRLSNVMMAMQPDGSIDTTAIIGKDVELMVDMREQQSITNGNNVNVNADMFFTGFPPISMLPSFLNLAQREENLYRSAAIVKVINRYGILDSVIQIDKGSKISTRDMMYDSETGDVVLTRTQNEFNDPLYNFNYPSHWAYDGMGMAYKNIGVQLEHINFKDGKIATTLPLADSLYFSGGDELLVAGKQKTSTATTCIVPYATFPAYTKVWAVDTSSLSGGPKRFYFVDKDGKPFTGYDVSVKIIRSGRRNMAVSIGSVTTLANPLVKNTITQLYSLKLDDTSKVVATGAAEFRQFWKVEDRKINKVVETPIKRNFTMTYYNGGTDVMTDIIKLSDNGFLMAGSTTANSNGGTDAYLVRTDSIGNVIWAKTYGGSENDGFETVKLTFDSGFIAIGTSKSYSSPSIDAFIVKINSSGSVQWSKKVGFGTTFGEKGTDILQTSDSGYAFAGRCNVSADSSDWFVGALSNSGNPIWVKRFGTPTEDDGIFLLQDNDTLVVSANSNLSPSYFDIMVLKLNRNTGASINVSRYDLDNNRSNYTGRIYKTENGYALAALNADTDELPLSNVNGSIVEISPSGQVIFARHLSRPSGANNRGIYMYPLSSGGFIASQAIEGSGSTTVYLHKINSSNGIDWSTEIVRAGTKNVRTILPIDNGFAGVGNFDDKTVLIRASAEGLVTCNDTAISSTFSSIPNSLVNNNFSLVTDTVLSNSTIATISITPQNVPLTDTISLCSTGDTVIVSSSCISAVTDTSMNPYLAGIFGNWRSNKSYVYYASRTESDPSTTTDIRTNGTFSDFSPFWKFQDSVLKPQYDTTRWVWNSELTLFNRKGMEIENKDPLERHNAGLYGYNETMPVAVIQNAHYRESAFEGFEDYNFSSQNCDTACPTGRHFDFTAYNSQLDSTQKHTGKRSLKIEAGESAGISFSLTTIAQDSTTAKINFSTHDDSCVANGDVLTDIRTTGAILLPSFSPFKGKQMLISAWVKEGQPCTTTSYANNRITIAFTGNGTVYQFTPTGTIIEGWQRYEAVFDIPSNATGLTINLEATGSADVYFDDIRIHPFNANMKSFVFNPVDLRLMAELDENNYASFYEYDDDGTLIRVKKETQRGIKTIKETRSALIKE